MVSFKLFQAAISPLLENCYSLPHPKLFISRRHCLRCQLKHTDSSREKTRDGQKTFWSHHGIAFIMYCSTNRRSFCRWRCHGDDSSAARLQHLLHSTTTDDIRTVMTGRHSPLGPSTRNLHRRTTSSHYTEHVAWTPSMQFMELGRHRKTRTEIIS